MAAFVVLELGAFTKTDLNAGQTVYAQVVTGVADANAAIQAVVDARQHPGRYAAVPAAALQTSMATPPPPSFTITVEP